LITICSQVRGRANPDRTARGSVSDQDPLFRSAPGPPRARPDGWPAVRHLPASWSFPRPTAGRAGQINSRLTPRVRAAARGSRGQVRRRQGRREDHGGQRSGGGPVPPRGLDGPGGPHRRRRGLLRLFRHRDRAVHPAPVRAAGRGAVRAAGPRGPVTGKRRQRPGGYPALGHRAPHCVAQPAGNRRQHRTRNRCCAAGSGDRSGAAAHRHLVGPWGCTATRPVVACLIPAARHAIPGAVDGAAPSPPRAAPRGPGRAVPATWSPRRLPLRLARVTCHRDDGRY
jgi:hypothetical protein